MLEEAWPLTSVIHLLVSPSNSSVDQCLLSHRQKSIVSVVDQNTQRGPRLDNVQREALEHSGLSSGIRELVERGEAVKRSQEPKGMDEAKETSVFRLQLDQCTHELQDRGSMHRIGTG